MQGGKELRRKQVKDAHDWKTLLNKQFSANKILNIKKQNRKSDGQLLGVSVTGLRNARVPGKMLLPDLSGRVVWGEISVSINRGGKASGRHQRRRCHPVQRWPEWNRKEKEGRFSSFFFWLGWDTHLHSAALGPQCTWSSGLRTLTRTYPAGPSFSGFCTQLNHTRQVLLVLQLANYRQIRELLGLCSYISQFL